MSNSTLERGKTTSDHPAERRAKLKRAGMSEKAELEDFQIKAIDALPEDASSDSIAAAAHGKPGKKARQVKVKYPEDVRAAYKRALELTGTPESGGPKYALTAKQADAIKRALAAKGKGVADAKAELEKVSDTQLRKIAKGDKGASTDAVKAVREFLKAHPALRDDRTMYGRKGAALVLAFREAA